MSVLISQFFHALMLGVVYSLIASGYTLIFGILNVVNFAHGDVCILGAFVLMTIVLIITSMGVTLYGWLPTVLLIIFATVITGGIGIVIERLTVKPFRKVGHMPLFLGSVALALIIREVIKHLYPAGANPKPFPLKLTELQFQFLSINFRVSNLIIIGLSAVIFIALFAFVNRTKIGLQIRAASEDIEAAQMMGVSLNKTYAMVYFIASFVGAIAGIANGVYFQLMQYNMGVLTGIIGFSAAIFGGLGNVHGAIIGGLILGFVESFSVAFIPGGAPYKEVFAFIIVIVFLAFKPSGILGEQAYEKV